MSDRIWRWRAGDDQCWSTSTRNFTGVVFRGVPRWRSWVAYPDSKKDARRVWQRDWTEAPGMQAPQASARYAVAIAGPDWPGRGSAGMTERYVLRASLVDVRAKLLAALERRQRAYDRRELAEAA